MEEKRPWTGCWEDYFGVGWWTLRYMLPHWFRANLAVQGLLPDLKQSIKEAAVISCSLQEPSKAAASRAQRHIYRFLIEEGWKRPRGGKGYERKEASLSSLWKEERESFDLAKLRERIRQQLAETLGEEAWDLVWSWATSKKRHRVPPEIAAILKEAFCDESRDFRPLLG